MKEVVILSTEMGINETVSSFSKRLMGFIRKRVNSEEDAEDILQDVWYQFSSVMEKEPIEQLSAWLFKVTRNKITDKYRKQKLTPIEDFAFEDEEGDINYKEILLADPSSPEDENLKNLFWKELFRALDELSEEQRQVFIWNELEDLSFEEISLKTGEKVNTLLSRKRYAVLHLRERLKELYKEIIEH